MIEQVNSDSIKAVKHIVSSMLIAGRSRFYQHMTKAVDGQIVQWMTDEEICGIADQYGTLEITMYRFMRENRNRFLSKENLLLSYHGAVKVFWISGGFSEAIIYQTQSGERMLCCANWTSGPVPLKAQSPSIDRIEKLVL